MYTKENWNKTHLFFVVEPKITLRGYNSGTGWVCNKLAAVFANFSGYLSGVIV